MAPATPSSNNKGGNWSGAFGMLLAVIVISVMLFAVALPMLGFDMPLPSIVAPKVTTNPIDVLIAAAVFLAVPILWALFVHVGYNRIVPWMVRSQRRPKTYVGQNGEIFHDRREQSKRGITYWYLATRLIPRTVVASVVIAVISLAYPVIALPMAVVWAMGVSWAYWLNNADRQNELTLVFTHKLRTVTIERTYFSWLFPGSSSVKTSDTPIGEILEVIDSTDPEAILPKQYRTSWARDRFTGIFGRKKESEEIGSLLITSKRNLAGDFRAYLDNPSELKASWAAARTRSGQHIRWINARLQKFANTQVESLIEDDLVDLSAEERAYLAPLLQKLGPALIFDSYTGQPTALAGGKPVGRTAPSPVFPEEPQAPAAPEVAPEEEPPTKGNGDPIAP